MSLKCPGCDQAISRLQLINFLRLASISCPRCDVLLTVDGRGRAVLVGSVLAVIPLAALFTEFMAGELAVLVAVVMGAAFGSIIVTRVGRFGISSENSEIKNKG